MAVRRAPPAFTTVRSPTGVQPCPSQVASAALVTSPVRLSSAGSLSTSVNSTASGDSHTAAPGSWFASSRAPAISQPAGPPASRFTAIDWGPPYSSVAEITSRSGPPAAAYQLLVLAMPCEPPVAEPSAASRPGTHAPAEYWCSGPYTLPAAGSAGTTCPLAPPSRLVASPRRGGPPAPARAP